MADKHRKKAEDAVLMALACGASIDQAARQCGLSSRTVYRRLAQSDFRPATLDTPCPGQQ